MATQGHLLVPKAMRMIKYAIEKTSRLIRDKLPQATRAAEAELQPAYAKFESRQAINRVAAIRQSQSRWYSTRRAINDTVRHFSSTSGGAAPRSRSAYPSSRIGRAVLRQTARAPFASTLRPNLTGGTLGRTAGGYGSGTGRVSGARYFSHAPAAQAQVVDNVSQAVRAFWLSGQKVQYDGVTRRGDKKFKSVSALQEQTGRKMRLSTESTPGSYVDFKVTPTITALGPLSSIPRSSAVQAEQLLNCEGFMDLLSIDFARALKDMAAIMNDLKRLSTLGDLPVSLHDSTTLRVRFPGCDGDSVERLCIELGISRGITHQDEAFDDHNGTQMALLFPFASSKTPSEATYSIQFRPSKRAKVLKADWEDMMSEDSPPHDSNQSVTSHDFEEVIAENPWMSSPSGYSSLHGSDDGDVAHYFDSSKRAAEYEGLEGVYKFLKECDRAKR